MKGNQSEQLTAALLTLERQRNVSIDDFGTGLGKHLNFRLKEGEGRNYQVYTPVEAGDYLKYFERFGAVTLAEQDAADDHLYNSNIIVSYKEDLAPMFKNMSYQQQWLDMENSTWIWDNKEGVGKFGVTTWTINQAKAIQMHKARAKLSRIAKENGKPNNWVWFITVGGEETLSLAIPYKNNTERGEVQSFADFAAQYIGDHEAENFQQQFNEGILKKDYMIWLYRADLSPKGEENKKD